MKVGNVSEDSNSDSSGSSYESPKMSDTEIEKLCQI